MVPGFRLNYTEAKVAHEILVLLFGFTQLAVASRTSKSTET